jgi:hypothetical protein
MESVRPGPCAAILIALHAACSGPAPGADGAVAERGPATDRHAADAPRPYVHPDGPALPPDLPPAPAFVSNCATSACQGGVDYFHPGDPTRYTPLPVTPERRICAPGDASCSADEKWLSGPAVAGGSDLDDVVALFVPWLRSEVRAYLAAPANRGVLVLVGGWGAQNSVGGWALSAAAWANQDPRLQLPVLQVGYYAPCPVCVTEYASAHADGLLHAKLLLAKLRRAGASGVLFMGHSAGADVVSDFAAAAWAEPGFSFAWALAIPNVPPIATPAAIPPPGPDPKNPTGGFFLYRRYVSHDGATVDYGGRLAVFNRASDCAANSGWSYLDCVDLPTHDYRGVLLSTAFRDALWAIRAGSYKFGEAIHGSTAEGEADRQAGVTFDCLDACP